MFLAGHISGCWPVHYRAYRKSWSCGRSPSIWTPTSPFARVSTLTLRTVCTLTTIKSGHGVKEPLLATSSDEYELNSASPYQQEHRYPSPQTQVPPSASPANSHPYPISPLQMSPSFQYTPPAISEQAAPPTTRPRSKSKPDEIFIHPAHSNIARAEVIAIRMGFGAENNEYVDASSYTYPQSPQNNDTRTSGNQRGWGTGSGRDVARGLLGGSGSNPNAGL